MSPPHCCENPNVVVDERGWFARGGKVIWPALCTECGKRSWVTSTAPQDPNRISRKPGSDPSYRKPA